MNDLLRLVFDMDFHVGIQVVLPLTIWTFAEEHLNIFDLMVPHVSSWCFLNVNFTNTKTFLLSLKCWGLDDPFLRFHRLREFGFHKGLFWVEHV